MSREMEVAFLWLNFKYQRMNMFRNVSNEYVLFFYTTKNHIRFS